MKIEQFVIRDFAEKVSHRKTQVLIFKTAEFTCLDNFTINWNC